MSRCIRQYFLQWICWYCFCWRPSHCYTYTSWHCYFYYYGGTVIAYNSTRFVVVGCIPIACALKRICAWCTLYVACVIYAVEAMCTCTINQVAYVFVHCIFTQWNTIPPSPSLPLSFSLSLSLSISISQFLLLWIALFLFAYSHCTVCRSHMHKVWIMQGTNLNSLT